MNSKQAGIYSITSKVNGKRYVGSAVRICSRLSKHLSLLKANKHHSLYLQNHYNKHGEQDLIFTVLEVIDRGELSLQEFKQLLLNKEQAYLDNWKECQFNCLKTAGSPLGHKVEGAKYFYFDKSKNQYSTWFTVYGKGINFSNYITEEEAIKEVEYLNTLTDDELLKYKQECLARPSKPYRRSKKAKNYVFDKQSSKWVVRFRVGGKQTHFGSYLTEAEAQARVIEVRKELGIE